MQGATTVIGVAERILPGGETLVRAGDRTLLVNNAAPGDELRLRITGKRRGAWRGEIVETVRPSAQRIAPPCPVADRCGGCALQHVSTDVQAAVKSAWVRGAFDGQMDQRTVWMAAQAGEARLRRRVRWSVGRDAQGLFLGFYAPATHDAVRHSDCIVLTRPLNRLRRLIEASVDLDGIDAVQAVALHDGIHVVLEAASRPLLAERVENSEGLPLQWWWRDAHRITRPLHKPARLFHDLLPAADADLLLRVGPDDFVQGEAAGNRALIAQIQQWAGPVNRVADLFCGIGNLSLPLAAACRAEVFGAELNAASVRAAAANAKMLGVQAVFATANLFEQFDMEPYIGADLLILDPPRRGARRICEQMSRLLPKRIVMISCDAAAGARDGALLRGQGYRLAALRALDLFPGAGHVEAMSLWEQA